MLKDSLGWGFLLWLLGYVLGIIIFFFVRTALIGWAMTPIGIAITVWVLLKRVKADRLPSYVVLALVWTVLAVVLDYLFVVKVFNPPDGYYKLDVYLYYSLTFIAPLAVGWLKTRRSSPTLATDHRPQAAASQTGSPSSTSTS